MTTAAAATGARPWWQREHGDESGFLVAYFSMEFGVDERLPVYSGGLGVLAGDHLKAAAALGVPLVGVGLLYRLGYFRQAVDAGEQSETYAALDPQAAGLVLERAPDGSPLTLTIDLAGEAVGVHVWRTDAAGVPLYLLDTDVEGNSEAARTVTDVLYGGDREHRLRQELVLGIGGPRALAGLGMTPSVFHVNEGHAAFLSLERVRALVAAGRDRESALDEVRASTVFTTHTPVPAGNERFESALVARYVGALADDSGFSLDELAALGAAPGDDQFGLTPLALRMAARANGVSRLHGEVARQMWAALEGAAPIGHVTNGVDVRTWLAPELLALLARTGVELDAPPGDQGWDRARELDREELRRVRAERKRALLARVGAPWLSPDALTIGFARRFATYKRAGLVFSDPARLDVLLNSHDAPVQLLVAGKAHPADAPGKAMLRRVLELAAARAGESRVIFLADYDLALAQLLVQGVDLWLNTPRRPQEACGTSGMKAALNGALNLSTLDGWWAEGYSPEIGWALAGADLADDDEQDAADAIELYRLLEDEVVPAFTDADTWIERAVASIAHAGSRFGADRMIREYVDAYYLPAHRR